ncbi:ABC transporter substrate-binding protein [Xanthobacter dioxanivorans]|uniref:ABC transporter substrate-binding protein n=1 Tax=Xanthobacter dioxanivorans TaxID=2528964 RepID=A0A974SHW9_9HYPH|nr:ABC transporter substrate-binding protein [Xanthobacter dioxanivorans]QRG05574.1 ABC transporter substrate-binding protein [Xanthobacter dioxanivorans]
MRSKSVFLAAALALGLTVGPLGAQTLRVGMTTSDVPTTGGIPDNGSEGGRFAGYPIYDALVNWDFTKTDQFADLTPGLATEWHIDPNDHTRWIFTLREGVKFHDGTDFKADDVIWNFDRHLNDKAPQFDQAQSRSYRTYTSSVVKYEKIDDTHVALYTAKPFSMLPYLISRVFMVSPTQYAKVGNWVDFRIRPAGTGPFKVERVTPRTSIELARNADYWDKTRIPKIAKLVLMPIPDANTRVAALRSGQVDWIEYPAPDSIPGLKGAGFQIVTKPYPHIWAWHANNSDNSPIHDKRVRLALNYGLDRDALVEMLAGTAIPARGPWPDTFRLFGQPEATYKYDPEKAKALLKEAGYGPGGKPLKLKVQVPTAGSGNMVPLPMAEFVQQSYKELGIDVEYEVVDWGTMLGAMRQRVDQPGSSRYDAINHGLPISDPSQLFLNFHSAAFPPNGSNWSLYKNPKVDELMDKAFATFEPKERDALIAQAHALIVDDAPWVFVVHDLNPRALSPKVKGFRQAQSWYQDFTQVTVEP